MASFYSSVLVLLLPLFFFFRLSQAKEYLVGGKPDSWKIPSSESDSLNHWAQKSRFQIGDTLVWNIESEKDSVMEVAEGDYVTCNTSNPIESYRESSTKVKLDRSGPFYFISGAQGHCEKGQKVLVVVMSHRHKNLVGISPAASPVNGPALAPSPTSGGSGLRGGFLVAMGVVLGFLVV